MICLFAVYFRMFLLMMEVSNYTSLCILKVSYDYIFVVIIVFLNEYRLRLVG